jgi:hypothetical protein
VHHSLVESLPESDARGSHGDDLVIAMQLSEGKQQRHEERQRQHDRKRHRHADQEVKTDIGARSPILDQIPEIVVKRLHQQQAERRPEDQGEDLQPLAQDVPVDQIQPSHPRPTRPD